MRGIASFAGPAGFAAAFFAGGVAFFVAVAFFAGGVAFLVAVAFFAGGACFVAVAFFVAGFACLVAGVACLPVFFESAARFGVGCFAAGAAVRFAGEAFGFAFARAI